MLSWPMPRGCRCHVFGFQKLHPHKVHELTTGTRAPSSPGERSSPGQVQELLLRDLYGEDHVPLKYKHHNLHRGPRAKMLY